ncbi:MAG: aromatic ring-hydroxylating dioxygenase subunit alpha [Solimicrobium sp.]|jgi:choline monooxygenase|nr:aromatic ring-hydroxylating dioxygenase subunit alpha [Solimicrobium sp.]
MATFAKLLRTPTQLPVSVYFDEALLQREIKQLFQQGPHYIGHELMVPNVGDFATVASEYEGRMLVQSEQGIELLSNVCRHRQALMFGGTGPSPITRGNVSNIVCPLHRWTYNLQGELLGAPHFDESPCLNLANTKLQKWNGLLFEQNGYNVMEKLSKLSAAKDLDFTGYMLDHVEVHECNYNWKTFIEVYLEDYHVEPFHPGLGSFVSCDDLRWEFGADYSVQTVGVNSGLSKSGSKKYQAWQEQIVQFQRRCRDGKALPYGAIWLTLYPNIMVEWYPHVLVISTLWPQGVGKTRNVVEFYYPEEIVLFERDFVEAERAAYMETCLEDDEIGFRMDAGRRRLLDIGENQVGPYQSPLEDGMQHFHKWFRDRMEF